MLGGQLFRFVFATVSMGFKQPLNSHKQKEKSPFL